MTSNTYIVVLCQARATALRAAITMLTPSLEETRIPARGRDAARRVQVPQRARSGRVAHSGRSSVAFERFWENHHRALTFQAGDQVCPEGNRVVGPIQPREMRTRSSGGGARRA